VLLSPPAELPRLLCLPYAGGRADLYRRWVEPLEGIFEVWAAELPGHGRRAAEPASRDADAVVAMLAAEVDDLLDRPMVIFGHGMGALLGFDLARLLDRRPHASLHLVVSGSAAPFLPAARGTGPGTDDAKLLALLRSWEGPRPTLPAPDREPLAQILPPLRADLALCNSYRYRAEALDVPVTALAGTRDVVAPPVEVVRWGECCSDWRGMRVIPGGHLFLHEAETEVLSAITDTLYPLPSDAADVTARAGAAR
jgi:surfactin synthase thioesterase subunit